MEEKIVKVLNEMSAYLTIAQMKKLQEIMLDAFAENKIEKSNVSNNDFLQMFLDAKKIEGCSERTIQYYQTTILHMFSKMNVPVRKITTEEIRAYLSEYQENSHCTNVTVDNIRRNISSFFSWLEEENYILKSPMRRIHKIKTNQQVKEIITDEDSIKQIISIFDTMSDIQKTIGIADYWNKFFYFSDSVLGESDHIRLFWLQKQS